MDTISDLIDFFRHSHSMSEENRFALVIDDQVHQEVQSEADCRAIDLGIGLGCDYVLVRGWGRPERCTEIFHYASHS